MATFPIAHRAAGWGFAGVVLAGLPLTAGAQSASGELAEVVVSARYREENLQQTPLTITALSTEDLENRSFTNVDDIGLAVPNAFFRQPVSNYGPTTTIGLRGIVQVDYSYSFEPAVAVYIDDIYHGTMTGSSIDLADLERVEVLNGPQGTLFGKNSIGGAIRLVSAKAKGDNTGSVQATYGARNRIDIKAIGDISLIDDKLFARFIGVSRQQNGPGAYLDFACYQASQGAPQLAGSLKQSTTIYQGNGCKLGGLGGIDHQGARLQLRLLATDKLQMTLDGDYARQADDPPLQALLTRYGGPSDATNVNYNNRQTVPKLGVCFTCDNRFLSPTPWTNFATFGNAITGQQYDPIQRLTNKGGALTTTYDFTDKLHGKLILSRREYVASWVGDSDLTPFGLTQIAQLQQHRQFQGEAQLSGLLLDDRLDWTLGAFYYDSKDRSYYPTNFDAFAEPNPPVFPNGLLPNFVADDRYTDENKSGFLHAAYKLTDRWSLSGGVRYTSEDKTNTFQHYGQIVLTEPKTAAADRWDYNATVDFQINPDMMIYGSYATGFRSPGFVPRISTIGQLVMVPAEEANQYELGAKTDFLDRRLRVNTSLFYIDYEKNLVQTLSRQCNLASDPNAGTPYPTTQFPTCPAGTPLAGTPGISPWFVYTLRPAIIRGAEMQVTAEPVERLMVNYSVGYNRIRRGDVDKSVRQQPDTNMSAGVQYAIPTGASGATLTPRLDAFYQSYQTNGATALAQRPEWRIPSYVLYNARLTFVPAEGGWQVDAGAENLFNKFYWQQLGPPTTATGAATVARVGTPGRPREWFVSLKKSF